MDSTNPIIREFMGHYALKYDFYSHLASMVGEQIRTELERRGIRAIVTFRAKSPDRLESKLIQRDTRKVDPRNYPTIASIETDIVDLAGVRIALYFPGDLEKVDQLISEFFLHTEPIKMFPESKSGNLSKGFVGLYRPPSPHTAPRRILGCFTKAIRNWASRSSDRLSSNARMGGSRPRSAL